MQPNKTTCPVCDWEIEPGKGLPVQVDGHTVQVCSDECATKSQGTRASDGE